MSETSTKKPVSRTETQQELEQLQLELQALKRIRSSLYATERMAGCLNQNIRLAIKNGNTLSGSEKYRLSQMAVKNTAAYKLNIQVQRISQIA